MAHVERIPAGSFLKQLIPVAALALCLAPSLTNAGSLLLLLHDAAVAPPMPDIPQQAARRPVDIRLNENGDLVIRQRDVSLTMAYAPLDNVTPLGTVQSRTATGAPPPISGISLKVSFLF